MAQPSEEAPAKEQQGGQPPAPGVEQDRLRAEMFLHVLPVARKFADFLKELPHEEIQGDGVAEKIARGAATQNPTAIFEHADQIADLPFAEELFVRAAAVAPKAAIEHAKAYSAQPYGDKVIEAAMRAASVSTEEAIKKLLFTHTDLYAEKPWAKELMLKALKAGPKEQRQWEVAHAALKLLNKYADQPYAEEVIRAALASKDGWMPFDYASSYAHLPCAKDVLVAAAIRFPWGMFARLQNFIEQPWADEVVMAAINSDHMKEADWRQALHDDVHDVLLEKGFAEAVYSALAGKFPNLIFDSRMAMDSKPWGKKILRQAMKRAAAIDPVEAIEHHPAYNRKGCWSSEVLDQGLMPPKQWEKILELSARSLLQRAPSKVFFQLDVFGDRSFAREVALEASSLAPAEALDYIRACSGRKKPSYINDMLEPAVRSAVSKAPKVVVKYISLFVEQPWAEEIMLQLAERSPDLVVTALRSFTAKPWANAVMLKAVNTRREAATRSEVPAGVA